MKKNEWTEERIEKLRELREKGRTPQQIASFFGDVTRNAVIGKIHRLGLSGPGVGKPKPVTMPTYSFMKK